MYELIEPLARTAGIDGALAEKPADIEALRNDGPRYGAPDFSIRELFAFGRDQSEADQMARSRQAHPA